MGKIEYELNNLTPKVDAGFSGDLLDPVKVRISKALGRYGAVPPFFIPRKEDIITQVNDTNEILDDYAATGVVFSMMPMRVKRVGDADFFTLPLEPLVSISGQNIITRRNVAKSSGKGSVKECWSQDDYDVTIRGVMTLPDGSKYPSGYIQNLIALFDERQSIEVKQEVLNVFNIHLLAIEKADFPHTKGMNNQNYEIRAYSDNPVNLLISI